MPFANPSCAEGDGDLEMNFAPATATAHQRVVVSLGIFRGAPSPASRVTLVGSGAAQRLLVFNGTSLDGYFTDAKGEMGFAYDVAPDPEFDAWTSANASGGGALLFGRKTYELMVKWWPTPAAAAAMPEVAAGMNNSKKYVASRTLKQATWQNTQLLKGDLVTEVRRLKNESGPGIAILGSGSIVPPLLAAGLIDEIQIVLLPRILGGGRTMFEGLPAHVAVKLKETRAFKNGNVALSYEPVR